MAYDNDVFFVLIKIRTDATTTKKKNESKIARTEPSLPPDSTRFVGNQRRSIKWKKQCGRYIIGRQRGLPGFGRMQRYPFTFLLVS